MNSSGSSVAISRSMESTSANRLNSTAFPSITGLDAKRPEIAEAEDGGSVCNDGDHVAARGVVVDGRRVCGDRLHRNRDAGRVGERQIALGRHRLCRHDLELSGPAARVKLKRLLIGDRGAFQRVVGLVSHGQFLVHARVELGDGVRGIGFQPLARRRPMCQATGIMMACSELQRCCDHLPSRHGGAAVAKSESWRWSDKSFAALSPSSECPDLGEEPVSRGCSL